MSASDKGGETAGGSADAGGWVDDFIFGNMGTTQENPPMELPAEKFQVKGFGEWGDGYKQVLYCVLVRGDGEADALAGVHSPLRVRKRR